MDGGRLEQVGIELPRHRHPFVDFRQIEREVEFGRLVVDPEGPRGETRREIEGRRGEQIDTSRRAGGLRHVLEREHDLKQRRAAEVARDPQVFHDPLERNVLMREGAKRACADAGEQFCK